MGRQDGFWVAKFWKATIPPLNSRIGLLGFLWLVATPLSLGSITIVSPSVNPRSRRVNLVRSGLALETK